MQFKLKDYFVEATQWFKHGDHPAVIARVPMDGSMENAPAVLPMENGDLTISPGDFIIEHPSGQIQSLPEHAFIGKYVPVLPEEKPVLDPVQNIESVPTAPVLPLIGVM